MDAIILPVAWWFHWSFPPAHVISVYQCFSIQSLGTLTVHIFVPSHLPIVNLLVKQLYSATLHTIFCHFCLCIINRIIIDTLNGTERNITWLYKIRYDSGAYSSIVHKVQTDNQCARQTPKTGPTVHKQNILKIIVRK